MASLDGGAFSPGGGHDASPAASAGQSPLPPGGVADPRQKACHAIGATFGLTERELAVLILLSQGHTNRHIAGEMYISINTVKTHTQAIYYKTGCHSKQEVINLVDQQVQA